MKKTALLLCALIGFAGVASASQATAPAKPAAKTHIVEAEVVSADVVAQTLTVKAVKAEKAEAAEMSMKGEMTMKVDAAAAEHLKTLKAGEKVKLTCRDNDKGEHEAISHITVEKVPAKK